MWFVSTSGRKFFAMSIKFLGLWLLVCVLWLTFTNKVQPTMTHQTAAKEITDSVTASSRSRNRLEINTPQDSMKNGDIIALSDKHVHSR